MLCVCGGVGLKMLYYWGYKIEDCASVADPRPFGHGVLLVVQFQLLQLHPLLFVAGGDGFCVFFFGFPGGGGGGGGKRGGDQKPEKTGGGGVLK